MEIDIEKTLQNYKERSNKKFPVNQRSEIIKMFIERLNADRAVTNYKPLTAAFIVMKMSDSGIKTKDDLEWFYGYCAEAKFFGKTWWWMLNSNNAKK